MQASWFIDPILGNDGNSGASPTEALKTVAMRQERFGPSAIIKGDVRITYLGAIPATDVENIAARVMAGSKLTLRGTPAILLIAGAATATLQAVTVMDRYSDQLCSVTAVGLDATHVGAIVRLVTGPNQGAYARIVRDHGNGRVDTTPFGIATIPYPYFDSVNPVVGQAIEVFTPSSIHLGGWYCTQGAPNFAGDSPAMVVDSLTVDGGSAGTIYTTDLPVIIQRSNLKFLTLAGSGKQVVCGGGLDYVRIKNYAYESLHIAYGSINSFVQVQSAAYMAPDQDPVHIGSRFTVLGVVDAGAMAFFDIPSSSDPAVEIRPSGTFTSRSNIADHQDLLWGTNNAGYGVAVEAGGKLLYATKPKINSGLGAGREARVGGTDKAWAAIPYVESANNAMIVPVH